MTINRDTPNAPPPEYNQRWTYWFWEYVTKAPGVVAGTYGGTGVFLTIAVDSRGRITSIGTAT